MKQNATPNQEKDRYGEQQRARERLIEQKSTSVGVFLKPNNSVEESNKKQAALDQEDSRKVEIK